MSNRRTFLKQAVTAGVAMTAMASSAASYARILGANDRVNAAFIGLGGRGQTLLDDFFAIGGVDVTELCDTDSRRLAEAGAMVANAGGKAREFVDLRQMLDGSSADLVVVATPDHWHTPAALMALQAGKHVYLEKPVSHNPLEGELLVKATEKYGKVLQVGNQQRSSLESIEMMQRVHDGELGDLDEIYTWYANNRGSIGNGKAVPVPDWLDWDLFQGPAPREQYRDNLVHYNWHWFWAWGTGETCNNAMHELDVARWAIGADYPDRVEAKGAKNFHVDDDREMYDTMYAEYRFGDVRVIWDGHSCNQVKKFGRGRGALIYGTRGSAMVSRNGYAMYDLDGNVVHEAKAAAQSATTDVKGGGMLNQLHIDNFLGVVRGTGKDLHSQADDGHKSTLLCHLANISQRVGQPLDIDPATGRLQGSVGSELWSRDYEPGWEPTV